MLKMDASALQEFLELVFPQAAGAGFTIAAVTEEHVRLRLPCREAHLRPGGTVSGPTLMALADSAVYLAILSRLGPVALAVTTSFEIHFLNKAGPGDVVAEARLLKLGKRLAVGVVSIHSDGQAGLIAHATATYSIPPG